MAAANDSPPPPRSRRDFLVGAGLGVAAVKLPELVWPYLSPSPTHEVSYAQCGEDLVARWLLVAFGVFEPTYLDIGAGHPTEHSNTYLFYLHGSRGTLVEPNPELCRMQRRARPKDTTVEAGIGFGTEAELDYYLMSDHRLNTFSKEDADAVVQRFGQSVQLVSVVKKPLRDVNKVIAENFNQAPNFVSIDVEGLDLAILKTFDFQRYRPEVFCVETLEVGSSRTRPDVTEFMNGQDYLARAATFPNTLYVDGKKWRSIQ
ncbi:MAG: FkbM family methyltransferase [Planctomycetia bacterium]|nr:FkbM family methyltransferase [Planctomycetia bacterium]